MHRISSTLPKTWAEDFVVELRLRGVSGSDIGDALAHVESYCQDSGELPDEAFGSVLDYARSLPFAQDRRDDAATGRSVLTGLASVLGLVGMLVSFNAFDAWRAGEAVALTAGWLTFVVVLIAGMITLTALFGVMVHHRVFAGIVVGVILGGAVTASVLLKTVAFTAPAALCGAVGVALLTVGGLLNARTPPRPDPVRDPTHPQAARSRLGSALLTWALSWMFVLMTVAGILVLRLLRA